MLITGTVLNASGSPLVGAEVTFALRDDARERILFGSGGTTSRTPVSVATNGSGAFSIDLIRGEYVVSLGIFDELEVSVPKTGTGYDITQILRTPEKYALPDYSDIPED